MTVARKVAWGLVAAGLAVGTFSDRAPARAPVRFGEHLVLAADFHTHTHPLSGSTMTPWDLPFEARRQGLDVVAITPHNGALAGRVGRWVADAAGITVIPGEEVHGPRYHLIALGTRHYVSWRLSAAEAVDEVHRQGGVAIAAHPVRGAWASFEDAKLDGAEVLQPVAYVGEGRAAELVEFWQRSGAAAIGSSDHHGMGRLGLCRTYVLARDASEEAVLEAIRARRTVAFDGLRAYGDPQMVNVVGQTMKMPGRPSPVSAAMALVGLVALVALKR